MEDFKRIAPSLVDQTPAEDEQIEWMFLMQHPGAPTRLLDWTESVLVALYFAVDENGGSDGEIWCLWGEELNVLSGSHGVPLSGYPVLTYLANESRKTDLTDLGYFAKNLNLDERPQKPLAIRPTLHFPRMVNQLSTFTIHPPPTEGNSIPELLTDEKHLALYRVPQNKKRELKAGLHALGITKRTLFPDLDSLSVSVVEALEIVSYGPPTPPRFRPRKK